MWTCVYCVSMQVESVVIRHPQRHCSLWEQQETYRGKKTVWKKRKKKMAKRWKSRRAASDLLWKPCICNAFVILHLLTKRCLQDDYQSADTNPADFKLQLTMMRKQIWNFELREAEIYFKAVFVFFLFFFVQPALIKLRWMLNRYFISTVTTHTLI